MFVTTSLKEIQANLIQQYLTIFDLLVSPSKRLVSKFSLVFVCFTDGERQKIRGVWKKHLSCHFAYLNSNFIWAKNCCCQLVFVESDQRADNLFPSSSEPADPWEEEAVNPGSSHNHFAQLVWTRISVCQLLSKKIHTWNGDWFRASVDQLQDYFHWCFHLASPLVWKNRFR